MSASMRQSQALLDGVESHKTFESLMEQMRLQQEQAKALEEQKSDMKYSNHEARDRAKMIKEMIKRAEGASMSREEMNELSKNAVIYDSSQEIRPTPTQIDKSNNESDPMFQKYRDMLINKEE